MAIAKKRKEKKNGKIKSKKFIKKLIRKSYHSFF